MKTVDIGRMQDFTLATTVTQVKATPQGRMTGSAVVKQIFIQSADTDVIVVTSPEATDGGAVPATGSTTILEASAALGTFDVQPGYRFLGLAGGAAGTARIELRG